MSKPKFIEVRAAGSRGSEGAILINVAEVVSIHMEPIAPPDGGQGVGIHLRDGRVIQTRTPYDEVVDHLADLGITPDGDTIDEDEGD